jgi:uncharacterized membrane protein
MLRRGESRAVDLEKTTNGRELDHTVFFSDAVFASTIKVMVLDVQVPRYRRSS